MHFYPHNIADFNHATRHLTRVERSVYRDAIELYYDTETELWHDIEKLARKLLCFLEDEKSALISILSEFFVKTETGYKHVRCDAEIAKYRANTSAKAKAGIASAKARQQKATHVQHTLNSVQQTNNQELITNIKPIRANALDDGFDEFWNAYPKKVGKAAAIKTWKKEKPNINKVLKSLEWQVKSEQWRKDDGAFIPNPATYINQNRWLDEPNKVFTVAPKFFKQEEVKTASHENIANGLSKMKEIVKLRTTP